MAFRNIYLGLMAFSFLFAISPIFPFFGANIAAYTLGCEPIISASSSCSNIPSFGVLFQLSYYWVITFPLGMFFFLLFGCSLSFKQGKPLY